MNNTSAEDLSKYGIDVSEFLSDILANEIKKEIKKEREGGENGLNYYQQEFEFNMNIYNKNIDHRIGKAALQSAQLDLFKIIGLIMDNINKKHCS